MDIFCLPLSTLVLCSFMTWYGLWMSNTMDTSIESGSSFPSRAHEFALCYQWGLYCLLCLPTCFHIFSYISYIHVKAMFYSPLLRFVLSRFHALFNVTLYFYLFTYSGIQCDFHINGWSCSGFFCVVFEGTIVCLLCVPSIPLNCMPFDLQLMITSYCIAKIFFWQKRTWHFGRWTNIFLLTHITRCLKTIWTYKGILI